MIFNDFEYVSGFRKTEHDINPLILSRWSPRAMDGQAVEDSKLMSLFEAAKWAPSASNIQPWRFLYAKKGKADWDLFFSTLNELNQVWVANASVIIAVVSQNSTGDNRINQTAAFDAGAAWQNLALQASSLGLVAHAMSGFDHDAARLNLSLPDNCSIHAMIAIGNPGPKESLPDAYREREEPSDRKFLSEIIREGKYSF